MPETTIQSELQRLQSLQLSLKEVLESYKHIVLTEDEMMEALIAGKRRKEKMLEDAALLEKEKANKRYLAIKWDFNVIQTFMVNRAKDIFPHEFILDDENSDCFELLCYYFIGDQDGFTKKARGMQVEEPSLEKGILLAGNFGSGKTVLMKLFCKNNRQVYFIRPAKQIANDFVNSEDKQIPEDYLLPFKTAINDAATMYQPIAGLCVDDLGSENVKNNYGNKMNVIGDLVESRYQNKYTGLLFHGTTNLSATELKDFYGERVTSRMREIFNFIEVGGNDRRK